MGDLVARLKKTPPEGSPPLTEWVEQQVKEWNAFVAPIERKIIDALKSHPVEVKTQEESPPASQPPIEEEPAPTPPAPEEAGKRPDASPDSGTNEQVQGTPPHHGAMGPASAREGSEGAEKETQETLPVLRADELEKALAACRAENAQKEQFDAMITLCHGELDNLRNVIDARYGTLKAFDEKHSYAWTAAREAVRALSRAGERAAKERRVFLERAEVARQKLVDLHLLLQSLFAPSQPEERVPETPSPDGRTVGEPRVRQEKAPPPASEKTEGAPQGEKAPRQLSVAEARRMMDEATRKRKEIEARLARGGLSAANTEVRGLFVSFLRARDTLRHALRKFIHLSAHRPHNPSPEEKEEYVREVAAAEEGVAAARKEFSDAVRLLTEMCDERDLLTKAPHRAQELAEKIRKLRADLDVAERHKPKAMAALSMEDYEEQWEAYEFSEEGRRTARLEEELQATKEKYAALVRALTALKRHYEEEARLHEGNAAEGRENPYYTPALFVEEAQARAARVDEVLSRVRAAGGEPEAQQAVPPLEPEAASPTEVPKGTAPDAARPSPSEAQKKAPEGREEQEPSALEDAKRVLQECMVPAREAQRIRDTLPEKEKETVARFLDALDALVREIEHHRAVREGGGNDVPTADEDRAILLKKIEENMEVLGASLHSLLAEVERLTQGGASGDKKEQAPPASRAAPQESVPRIPEEEARSARRNFHAFMVEMQERGKDPARHFLYGPLKRELTHLENVLDRFELFKRGNLKEKDETPRERLAAAFRNEFAWRAKNIRGWIDALRAQLADENENATVPESGARKSESDEVAPEKPAQSRVEKAAEGPAKTPTSAEAASGAEAVDKSGPGKSTAEQQPRPPQANAERERREMSAEQAHLAEVLRIHEGDSVHEFLDALRSLPARPEEVGGKKFMRVVENFSAKRAECLADIDLLNRRLRGITERVERLDNPKGVAKILWGLRAVLGGEEKMAEKKFQLKNERDRLVRRISRLSAEADLMLLYHSAAHQLQKIIAKKEREGLEPKEILRRLLPREGEAMRQWWERLSAEARKEGV